MTEEESNFILITKINEFPMNEIVPMSVAYSYPFIAIVTAPTEILLFNLETRITSKLERKTIYTESVVLCSVISDDKSFIATGHNDSYGGEVVLWSLSSLTEVFSFRLNEGVSQVQFGLTSDSILHSDSMGVLTLSTITTKFFKKVVTHQVFRDFGSPLVTMAVHKRHLFTSSSNLTQCFTLDFFKDNEVWRESEPSNCFAFLDTPNENYVARGVGHDVIVTTLNGKNPHTYEFSRTPNVISFIDLNTILVLFAGNCEMIRENIRFHRKVPPGIALALSDRIFIAGQDLLQLSLASVEQRVDHYITENEWGKAFEQISSAKEIPNIYDFFNKFINSNSFDPEILFKNVDRLQKTDFIIDCKFTEKNELILNAFAESDYIKWNLTEKFIEKLISEVKDDDKLSGFLMKIEINRRWLPNIYQLLLKRNMLSTVSQLALVYSCDYFVNLLIAHYQENFCEIHRLLDILLMSEKLSPQSAISYLESVDLTYFVAFNKENAIKILSFAFDYLINHRLSCQILVNKVIPAIDKDDEDAWKKLVTLVTTKSVLIQEDLIPYIENYVYASNCDKTTRGDLLVYLLASSQITDTQRALDLVRNSGLQSCELAIIISIHDVDEYFSYIVDNKKSSFRSDLYKVVKDTSELKKIYIEKAHLLMSVNPDEFCEEVVKLENVQMIHEIYDILSKNKVLTWHFMKRVFCRPEFTESATSEEVLTYITFLARYNPSGVYSALKAFHNIPLDQMLEICKKHGIVDATLYLCGLSYDFDGALKFGTAALETSLMENQSSLIVSQICNYLTSTYQEDKITVWLKFLATFQIPIYVYYCDPEKASPEKLEPILELLGVFLDSMIRDLDSATIVATKFIDMFSFLPFQVARSIITRFFKSIREKNQFSGTLVQIEKFEAVNIQMNRLQDLAQGKEYDGIRCANCGKLLGQSDAVAYHCGHVFHAQCSTSGWCKICEVSIERSEKPTEATPDVSKQLVTLDQFSDEIPELEIFKKEELHRPMKKMLDIPTIGYISNV
ncbi:hypothetical protein TRFO_23854 [Tritrichomonas foetus]|uniref:C2H2-type domain-containing protein n=1 Tax=Tritrichomonas foetus TaxID=1144522 RepID=A0A1J4KA77_9EUKA|nr:hypothetical protein TRFO_23854 [Tritrichomonas foetus]|eukprot:OHT07816.1 hypothetical protein TRFO_23854 [Tritrichomonas foetus]